MKNTLPILNKPYDDGGPAFPCERFQERSGMTLRDWFIGQALAGLCAEYSRMTGSYEECTGGVASAACSIADAVMKERGQS